MAGRRLNGYPRRRARGTNPIHRGRALHRPRLARVANPDQRDQAGRLLRRGRAASLDPIPEALHHLAANRASPVVMVDHLLDGDHLLPARGRLRRLHRLLFVLGHRHRGMAVQSLHLHHMAVGQSLPRPNLPRPNRKYKLSIV